VHRICVVSVVDSVERSGRGESYCSSIRLVGKW
jgi:hypothetical protein